MTPTPDTRARIDDPNDPLNQHAEQIKKLAQQYNTGFVDSLRAFREYVKEGGHLKDIMCQYNHPNRKGHNLVVKELLEWFP
jgi:acyl-CoA thioesterase-1